MARKLNFVLPTDELKMADNWTKLRNSVEQREYDPFFGTTPATEGFSHVDSYWGYYFCIGPLVFFTVTMIPTVGDSVTWSAGAAIKIPLESSTRGSTYLLEEAKGFPAINPGHATTVADWFILSSTSVLADNGHSPAGGNEKTNVSGWYFRE